MRTFILAVTTLVALAVAAAGIAGYARPLYQSVRISPNTWVYFVSTDGLLRCYSLHADEPIVLQSRNHGRHVDVFLEQGLQPHRTVLHARPSSIDAYALLQGRLLAGSQAPNPPVWISGVRTRIGPLIGALLIVPGLMIVARKMRQSAFRPGFCHRCGYNLAGNSTGICPECGEPLDERLHAR